MKHRYYELKKLFKDYIIIFIYKNNYKTINIDNKIIEYLKCKNILDIKKYNLNYLIIDNLDIIEKKEYENNKYKEYLLKVELISIINKIGECI